MKYQLIPLLINLHPNISNADKIPAPSPTKEIY